MYEIERYTSVNALGAAVVLEEATAVRDRLQKVVVASSMSIYGEGLYRCSDGGNAASPGTAVRRAARAARMGARCPSCGARSSRSARRRRSLSSRSRSMPSASATTKRCSWPGAAPTRCRPLRFASSTSTDRGRRCRTRTRASRRSSHHGSSTAGRRSCSRTGVQSRDFVHVSDIAAGVEAALEPGRGRLPHAQPRHRRRHVDPPRRRGARGASSAWTSSRSSARRIARATSATASPTYRSPGRSSTTSRTVAFGEGMDELAGWLADQEADDHVDQATAALVERGLAG